MSVDAFLVRVPPLRAAGILDDVSVARRLVEEAAPGSEQRLELDEAWAPVHFGLTGELPVPRQIAEARGLDWSDDSLENVLMGGDATPLLTGFGPARYLAPALVQAMATRLSAIPAAGFGSRVTPEELVRERVLPNSWELDTAPDRLQHYYANVQDFYAAAAEAGDGLLVGIG